MAVAQKKKPAPKRLTREESRALTREKLLASAYEVMAREGYEGASIDRIAEEAGFSKGAFYSNFDSKEEIFLELLETHSVEDVSEIAGLLRNVTDPRKMIEIISDWAGARAKDPSWGMLALDLFRRAKHDFDIRQASRPSVRETVERPGRHPDRHVSEGSRASGCGDAWRHRVRTHLWRGFEFHARPVGQGPREDGPDRIVRRLWQAARDKLQAIAPFASGVRPVADRRGARCARTHWHTLPEKAPGHRCSVSCDRRDVRSPGRCL